MARQRGYEVLGLALLGLLMIAPAAAANTPPVCADVTATVQNIDARPLASGGPPWITIAAACSDPDPGTTLRSRSAARRRSVPGRGSGGFRVFAEGLFSGTDTFDYVALDGTDVSNAATVTITVLPPPGRR